MRASARQLDLAWEETYDGGDEIYQYILSVSEYDCKWEEKEQAFFDGFRPWYVIHEGPASVLSFTFSGLKPANEYKFSLVAQNSNGCSTPASRIFETLSLGNKGHPTVTLALALALALTPNPNPNRNSSPSPNP